MNNAKIEKLYEERPASQSKELGIPQHEEPYFRSPNGGVKGSPEIDMGDYDESLLMKERKTSHGGEQDFS